VTLLARPMDGVVRLPMIAEARVPPGDDPLWISEAVRDLWGWRPGNTVRLPLAGREHAFRVAGVWRDYARQQGSVVIERGLWQRLTGERRAHDGAVFLAPGADTGAVAGELAARLGAGVRISSPAEVRALSLQIFDRSFAVTYLLEAVAVLIGLFGIGTSFAALATARRKEFGMLRHLGVTRGQIGAMLGIEGVLTAGAGVLAGLAAGGAIGLVLIRVVNRQSFHWSMDVHLPLAGLALFAAALIALAGLAAVLAGRQAMRPAAVLAVREDW
jgi:putative ABC transport system permease protein